MSTLLEILVHDILPVFIAIGLGYSFARRNHAELRTATRLTFYVLSPCLVFVSLVESNIDGGETAQIFLLVLLMVLVMGALAWVTGRAMRLTSQQLIGFLLAAMFVNAGNYGLGVTRLAFGDEAEARAVIYFVSSSILIYTLGTLIASGFKGGWRGAIKHLLMLPQVYALLAVVPWPSGLTMVRFTGPSAPTGLTTSMSVGERTVAVGALLPPKLTDAPTWKPAPLMRTVVPPWPGPVLGVTSEMVGGGTT